MFGHNFFSAMISINIGFDIHNKLGILIGVKFLEHIVHYIIHPLTPYFQPFYIHLYIMIEGLYL